MNHRRWFALTTAVALTLLAQLWLLADGAEAEFVIVDDGVALAFVLAGLGAWWCGAGTRSARSRSSALPLGRSGRWQC